jgi:hypothetical protein
MHNKQQEKPFMKQLDILESEKRNDFKYWNMKSKPEII